MNFHYDEEAIRYLKAKDPILADIIDRIGPIERPIEADLFSALINNIVGQQISMRAQETVWKRMIAAFGAVTPKNLCRVSIEEIQQCGLSTRKATYIREAAEKVISGECDLEALKDMSDEEVIAELSQLRGIGKWTAEMLLIFSMGRQDVLSWDDLAIHRGLRMVYHHRKITKPLFQKYKRRYAPYGSVASLYLWEVSVGILPGLKDYAPLTEAEKKKRQKQRQQLKRAEKQRL
jgi:DNA-3-methyladenine glycosylase II